MKPCGSISDSSDDDALFDAILNMAQHLDDGYIQLENDSREDHGWSSVWADLDREEQVRELHIEQYGPLKTAGLGQAERQ